MTKKVNSKTKKYLLIFWAVILLPIMLFSGFIAAISAGIFGKLPSFEELENPKSNLAAEIYSSDQVVLGKYYIENRSNVHYEKLSPNLINALKATEDIRFEEHSGVDLRGLFRVFFKTIFMRKESSGGGSTLTQQLAKNLFPRENVSGIGLVVRKIKEWIIAVRLEKNYTKEEILAMYLNTVEFGSNAFGIKSASRTFFNSAPDTLSVNQSAVLVGLLKAPTWFSPLRNPKNSMERRNVVLHQMMKYDFISEVQFDSLKVLPIELKYTADDHNFGLATHFREVIRGELVQWCKTHTKADGTPYNLYRDGLRIYTTINSSMQRYAEEAMREHLTELQRQFDAHWKGREPWKDFPEVLTEGMKRSDRYIAAKKAGMNPRGIKKEFNTPVKMTLFSWKGDIDTTLSPMDSIKYYKKFLQSGFMSMEPQTGYVRAWVGGLDYRYFKYDHVKMGTRQVGSTFKPFLYTVAMQEGYSPCYKVPNVRVNIPLPPPQEPWSPENADGKYGGMLTLKYALAESVNCVSAYLMKQFGPQAMIDVARRMGITTPIDAVPSICLGTADVSLYEMVGAYSTFADKGVWTEPVYITRIEDKSGNVLEEKLPRKVEAINEETAYLMLNMMQGATLYGTSVRLRFKYNFTNSIAAKTGTTQNQSDGWFMGITPDLVSGVWTGCEDRSIHFRSLDLGQGANTALPVWALYMQKVYADSTLHYSKGDFEKPSEPLHVEVDCAKYNKQDKGKDDDKIDF
ncbi:MAG TPA: transglycosylase domain-containing protein [Bacteroidia bacterium]|nr:transglycosylase domain-containing protein [Bacteroidia bacterium]